METRCVHEDSRYDEGAVRLQKTESQQRIRSSYSGDRQAAHEQLLWEERDEDEEVP